LQTRFGEVPLKVFGEHNLQNIAGAKNVCNELGVFDEDFYKAIATFEGAANRLQLLAEGSSTVVFKDFAHSPSKLTATVSAMKQQFKSRKLVAVMELHTFSSLNKDFMKEYAGSMDEADVPVVFFDKHTFEHKKMPLLDEQFVKENFANQRLRIFTDAQSLQQFISAAGVEPGQSVADEFGHLCRHGFECRGLANYSLIVFLMISVESRLPVSNRKVVSVMGLPFFKYTLLPSSFSGYFVGVFLFLLARYLYLHRVVHLSILHLVMHQQLPH
jgi:hypothetical protein